jgi:hypothetical protein
VKLLSLRNELVKVWVVSELKDLLSGKRANGLVSSIQNSSSEFIAQVDLNRHINAPIELIRACGDG